MSAAPAAAAAQLNIPPNANCVSALAKRHPQSHAGTAQQGSVARRLLLLLFGKPHTASAPWLHPGALHRPWSEARL